MTDIKKIVLDVLKPHQPSIVELSRRLAALHGVVGVNCMIDDKITLEGTAIDYEKVEATVRALGAVIHSIDSVSAGKKIVDATKTPQDL
ncbi:MAG: hypothetical protein E6K18_08575 [Methanobacteriota archaeon]|nr:MAG: hypothetical protein E6K18_08575 [Euryarchaeota archaeon]